MSLDWLLESVQAKKPLPEKSYILGQKAGSQSAQDDTKNGQAKNGDEAKSAASKKRTVKQDEANGNGGASKSSTKKEGTKQDEADENGDAAKTNGKKRGIKQEDDREDESNKKQKDSQKAGFKSLNIPVDEDAQYEVTCE